MALAAEPTLIHHGSVAFVGPTADTTIDGDTVEADSAVGLEASFE